jgi:membrane protease YdiL (CAAX protease family)
MSNNVTSSADVPAAGSTRFFFLVALTLCWVGLLTPTLAALGILSGPPDAYMAGAPLAVFSPTIAAVLAARREGGWPAVRAVMRGFRAWRVRPIWFVLALTLPALVYTAGRAVYALVPGSQDIPWVFLPERPEHIAGLFIVPIGEEIGWRGYALPRLLARHGAPRATVILGVLWALWHVPMFVSTGSSLGVVGVMVLFIAVGNPFFTWFYRRTGGSLLLAVLLHFGVHLDAPTHALPANAIPLYVVTAAYLAVAIALPWLDRRAFEGTTPEAPGTPSART